MEYKALQELLNCAENEIASCHYKEAEKLCHEIIANLIDDSLRARAYRLLSESLWRRGMVDEALPLEKSALSIAIEAHSTHEVATSTNTLGLLYRQLSDFPLALNYLNKALELYEEIGDKDKFATITGNIGNVYSLSSDYPLALEYFATSLSAHQQLDNTLGVASVRCSMGLVYTETGNYEQALGFTSQALALYQDENYLTGVGIATFNIGNIYASISDYTNALEFYGKALIIHEELDNKSGVAFALGGIGSVHADIVDYPRALEYYGKALTIHEGLGNSLVVAGLKGNIANIYADLKDYPKALEFYTNALVSYEKIGSMTDVAEIQGNIATVYHELLDYRLALEYYYKAQAGNEVSGRDDVSASVIGGIGTIFANQNFDGYNLKTAEEYLLVAVGIMEKIGSKRNSYELHQTLAQLYENTGDIFKALRHYKQYHTIEKEVQSEETKKIAQRSAYERQIGEMQREHSVTDLILHNILPKNIALRIRRGEKKIVDSYESVSILFADIVGFTKLSQRVTPEHLVEYLDRIFNTFDQLADIHGCEKIKTIGDCYMVVTGLPERCADHTVRLASMALDMLKAIENFPVLVEDVAVTMRIGLHTGSVVAGIIGKNKYSYDMWGDAVNTASRMESHGEAGKIHCTEDFLNAVGESSFQFEKRGEMEIKGKGMMKTYFLTQTN